MFLEIEQPSPRYVGAESKEYPQISQITQRGSGRNQTYLKTRIHEISRNEITLTTFRVSRGCASAQQQMKKWP